MNWSETFGNPKNSDELKRAYRDLAKKYHPDVNPSNASKFSEITELYNQALKILGETNKLVIDTLLGNHLEYTYIKKYTVGNENVYLSDEYIVIEFTGNTRDEFYKNFLAIISDIRFESADIEKACKFLKSRKMTVCKSSDYNYIIQYRGETLPLGLVLNSEEFKNDPDRYRHCVWVMNRLFTLACVFNSSGLGFNGFDINNIYVDMKNHVLHLINGFQYSCKIGDKLRALPKFVFNNTKVKDKQSGECTPSIDTESILAIGRIMFDTGAPSELREFCCNEIANTPLEAWRGFEKVYNSVYDRRFVEFDIHKLSNWKTMLN